MGLIVFARTGAAPELELDLIFFRSFLFKER